MKKYKMMESNHRNSLEMMLYYSCYENHGFEIETKTTDLLIC